MQAKLLIIDDIDESVELSQEELRDLFELWCMADFVQYKGTLFQSPTQRVLL